MCLCNQLYLFAWWVKFHAFLYTFLKNLFRNTSVKLFGSRQEYKFCPELGPNCLQRLSADINVATNNEGITIQGLKFQILLFIYFFPFILYALDHLWCFVCIYWSKCIVSSDWSIYDRMFSSSQPIKWQYTFSPMYVHNKTKKAKHPVVSVTAIQSDFIEKTKGQ